MDVFYKVLNSCFTEEQIPILRQALKSGVKVYFYGRGLGKSVLAEVLANAGFKTDEPGTHIGSSGPLEVLDEEGMIAFCVKNNQKERIPHIYDILLGCGKEIADWVNQ